jgi:predicted HAD superfamily hydrolase
MIDTKNPGIFNRFRNLESIEFKVPMVCLVTGCVSRRRDTRYDIILQRLLKPRRH